MNKNIQIAIFASGSGSNAEEIIQYFTDYKGITPSIIISNKKDAFVHERAKKYNIPSKTFSKDQFHQTDFVTEQLKNHKIDFIVLAGFLLHVPDNITKAYPNAIINIHPALLPKYGGKGMYGMNVHQAVYDNNEKESGITIHYVNENYDEGAIIFQASCPITSEDKPNDIANKIHELEHKHFPRIIHNTIKNNFK